MAKEKELKTNVMRILDREKIPCRHYSYGHGDGKIDGCSVAEKLGQNPARVYKTLVTRGASGEYYVFVLPVGKELDRKAAARSVGEKSVELIRVDEINKVTGYIRGGCSPIGMKKQYRTVVDESCLGFEAILYSGGKLGVQVETSPADLLRLTGGKTAPVAE